jgi:hypothetical protein
MYISGAQTNYENRIHQLIENLTDFQIYCVEGSGYVYNTNQIHLNKWNKELKHVYYELTSISVASPFLTTGNAPAGSYLVLQGSGYLNLAAGDRLVLL